MVGGIPGLKEWIVNQDPGMVQVPYPDGFRTEDVRFEVFEQALRTLQVKPTMCSWGDFRDLPRRGSESCPKEYIQELRKWCDVNGALLIFDEVQAGFGRTGRLFGFEHYDVVPDLACFGKGFSSSLPISAVLGRKDVMDLYPPGAMTSTHTGNPLLQPQHSPNLEILLKENLAQNAFKVGGIMHCKLAGVRNKYPRL